MTAYNYSTFKGSQIKQIKFGGTAWTSAQWSATATTLHGNFDTNNATALIDLCGTRDSNNPVKSEAFATEITFSGNERTIDEQNLLGVDSTGAQNKEVIGGSVSMQDVEIPIVLRNNVPLSIFNDSTRCCLIELDNDETTTSGVFTIACNNIKMKHVGSIKVGPDGLITQSIKFSFKGGTTGTPVSVSNGGHTYSKVSGGNYSEEVMLS